MPGGAERDEDGREEVVVAVVGPDPRLLALLVVLLGGLALWLLLGSGDDRDTGTVPLGTIAALATQAESGPVPIAALPHLVVSLATTPEPVYDARWGQNTGAVLLNPREQLVVLETRDPEDGGPVTWCRAAAAFTNEDHSRWYASDGRLLAGDGRRGLDRRALEVVGGASLRVDDDRWVRGPERHTRDTGWTPAGPCPTTP